jgi:DNA replication and repair protein RecF
MRLTRLAVRDWRNLHAAELWTDARFVVLHGDNAQGKTNLLEAVWMLATLRSFREARPRRLIREGSRLARIEATSTGPAGTRRLQLRLGDAGRRLQVDGVVPPSLTPWFEAVRAVLFCPEHSSLVRGGPDERRDFLDRAVFTARPAYLEVARDYRRLVQQKAALLREGRASAAELAAWNQRLVDLGGRVAMARHQVLQELSGPVQAMHAAIAGPGADAGQVELSIRSLGGEEQGVDEVRARLQAALDRFGGEERRRGRVLVGPHRDDLVLRLEGRLARDFASQGQARSLVLALKLAELAAARARGQAPLLLIDDLTSELDRGRMRRLVEVLAALDNQVWVTTTDAGWLGPLPEGEAVHWRVRAGQVFGGTRREEPDPSPDAEVPAPPASPRG